MKSADIACLRIAGNDAVRVTTIARELLGPAQDADIAVLLDDVELAQKLSADGVHLADPTRYAEARRQLGAGMIVGVACPLERHVAMEVAEAGADYVHFSQDSAGTEELADLIGWWAEMMTVPSVAYCRPDPDVAAATISMGADFLAPDVTLWQQPDPVALLARLLG
jgi:thiamine-phosphate pyrophosphorylase